MCRYSLYSKMLAKILLVSAVSAIVSCDKETSYSALRIAEHISVNGYPAETHHVTTIDGYILEMHRIPRGRNAPNTTTNRPVVFLMHGLMAASNSYILLGPDYSIAYNLADAGFDVWMGNARGNWFSRYHTSLDPDDEVQKFAFFDFTFEEIGLYDIPTMIDYILENTQKQKLHYIGLSQGGTTFFVFLSLKPDYNDKISSAHLLAPVGYQEYFPNPALASNAAMVDIIYLGALLMGIVELYPELFDLITTPRNGYKIADYCTGNLEQRYMCDLFGVKYLLRDDIFEIPAGASLKQAAHYGQNIRDKLFRRYHHGTEANMVIYGQEEPPLYNISLITADVTIHYTVNDEVLDERDVLAMAADMPNAKVRKVARETFLHSDFVVALDAKELVTDYIIEALRNTSDMPDQTTIDDSDVIVVTTGEPEADDINLPETNSTMKTVMNLYLIILGLFVLHK